MAKGFIALYLRCVMFKWCSDTVHIDFSFLLEHWKWQLCKQSHHSELSWYYLHEAWGGKYQECQEAKAKPCREFPGHNSSKPIMDPWWNLLETTTHEEIHYEHWS